jgi:hypothetical protein
MSLFPNEDILTKEIGSWKGFANSLSSSEDKELFMKMLNGCYEYASAINAKGEPFPSEPLIMALLLSQHKIIEWLTDKISRRVILTREAAPKQTRQWLSSNSESNPVHIDNAEDSGSS